MVSRSFLLDQELGHATSPDRVCMCVQRKRESVCASVCLIAYGPSIMYPFLRLHWRTEAHTERASERERGHSPREQGGGGPRLGPAGVLRTSPTAPFRMCVARGVQVHQQCKSLRLSRKAQHFAGKGEGGANGKGQVRPASQPVRRPVQSSQVSQVSLAEFLDGWTG